MTKTVLLGWELGGGQGHIQRLMAIASHLEKRGFTPVFALKSYRLPNGTFPWRGVTPPILPYSGDGQTASYADILAGFGFGDRGRLQSLIHNWERVLKHLKPCLAIADHAPGLVLAAHGKIPTLVVGTGYTVPVSRGRLPLFRLDPAATHRQRPIEDAIRTVLDSTKEIAQMLAGDRHLLFTIPELDPYAKYRIDPQYVGIHNAPIPRAQPIKNNPWIYIGDRYKYKTLVTSMIGSPNTFEPLAKALEGRSLVCHHGGLTTAIAALLSGIPQLILPTHNEQRLNGKALQSLGVAAVLEVPGWRSLDGALCLAESCADAAEERAIALSDWNRSRMDVVMAVCEDMAS